MPSVGQGSDNSCGTLGPVTDEWLLGVLGEAAEAVAGTLRRRPEGPALTGEREGQYHLDVAADRVAVAILTGSGLGVVSEESGVHAGERDLRVVIDPVDGSTNAHRRIPWFATSLCVLDDVGPRVSLVVNQATGDVFSAIRGGGATLDGGSLAPSEARALPGSVVAVTGVPAQGESGWWQFRALGAVALDLCAVASGSLDAYVDFTDTGHAPWDYLGALLVCREAGVSVVDRWGRDLVCDGMEDRRHVVAAATPELLADIRRTSRLPGWPEMVQGIP